MKFGHEKLDVYQLAIEYVAWAYKVAKGLNSTDRHSRDQLLRASQSIPLNIAEGNGKGTAADRRRYFEIARGSAMECAAIQDCLTACEVLNHEKNNQGKAMLVRIVAMLTKLGKRDHDEVREEMKCYGIVDEEHDTGSDNERLSRKG